MTSPDGPGTRMSDDGQPRIESISAVTLFVADMARAVRFYEALGFDPLYGGSEASFTSFRFGDNYLNLTLGDRSSTAPLWGRIILHVSDVDGLHRRCLSPGPAPRP